MKNIKNQIALTLIKAGVSFLGIDRITTEVSGDIWTVSKYNPKHTKKAGLNKDDILNLMYRLP